MNLHLNISLLNSHLPHNLPSILGNGSQSSTHRDVHYVPKRMVGWFLVLNATLSNISAISTKRRIELLSRYGLLGYIKVIQKACPYTIVCVVFIKYFGTWRVWALYQHQASFFIYSYPTLYTFPVAVKTNNSQPMRMTDQSHVTFFKYEFLR